MILTLTPNPAVDVTYRIPSLTPGASHRASSPRHRAGGKGVNSSGVLAAMGVDNLCAAAIGLAQADWWEADLTARGVAPLTIRVPEPYAIRTCLTFVTDDGQATVVNEEGVSPDQSTWQRLREAVLDALASSEPGSPSDQPVLVVAGSLPIGTSEAAVLDLIARAQDLGAAVIVDGSGTWLEVALGTGPTVVRPNLAEAAHLTGYDDPHSAARALVEAGAQAALVSNGSAGAVLHTPEGTWQGYPRTVLSGNPTGAGDAGTAAIAAHLLRHPAGPRWPDLLADAMAWSAAAVLADLAGTVAPSVVERLGHDALISRTTKS
ncbi:MAG: 1-phosphofructokinase family hexose kinase [Nostocoides sp.]